jgi:hypothetical protein
MDSNEQLTLGIAATLIGGGVQRHHLGLLAKRALIPHTAAGRIRLVLAKDLPEIRAVCERAGYFKQLPEIARVA